MKKHIHLISVRTSLMFSCLLLLWAMTSCQKDFLAAKPNQSTLIPTTLSDFDALLDNQTVFNISPGLGLIGSDDFFSTDAGWLAWVTPSEREAYLWLPDVYQGYGVVADWNTPYQQVFYANVVLDGLNKLSPDSLSTLSYNRIKGSALFCRGLALYNLTQLFAKPYNPNSASADLGIPVRLTPDVNAKPGRGTLQEVYDQILSDLGAAEPLLPLSPSYKSRPGKAAADAMLARIYLSMGNYSKAMACANAALNINNSLIDYNTLSTTAASPFPIAIPNGNSEVIYYSALVNYSFNSSTLTQADPSLYASYDANDLRKTIFFKTGTGGVVNFKGNYTGKTTFFGGVATDELFLIRAECEARASDMNGAMTDLNTLLQSRFKKGFFTPLTAVSGDDALKLVLQERRKELVSRSSRWSDLRRLNTDPRFAVTLSRVIQQQNYVLVPGSDRYVLPIPDYEITLSGLPQNPR